MEDLDFNTTKEFTQGTLDTISENFVYGLSSINNFIKQYNPIKYPIIFVEAGSDTVSDNDPGNEIENTERTEC